MADGADKAEGWFYCLKHKTVEQGMEIGRAHV